MPSYSRGADAPLWDHTIGRQLERAAAQWPTHLALRSLHRQQSYTWAELLDAAKKLAQGMARLLGPRFDARVGIWAKNCAEWVVVQFACALTGIVLVNINPAYATQELETILRRSRVTLLFFRERDRHADYGEILGKSAHALDHAICIGSPQWNELLSFEGHLLCDPPQPHDIALIQYTSGTTGSPKGVQLTHHNILNNGMLNAQALRLTPDDRICIPVPLAHCFGCVIGTMSALASGAAMILPGDSFDAAATLRAVEAEQATVLYGVPAMFIAELDHPNFPDFDLSSLRTGVIAGAPCSPALIERVIREMRCPGMTVGYGLTETSPAIATSAWTDDGERRVSGTLTVLPRTEVKIVSIGEGEVMEPGLEGEICARGYLVMKGYDGGDDASRTAIDAEGWFHTGDLGIMRNDGCFHVTGRAKDVIVRGGENISPLEVERFLAAHPAVADVHVTGFPHDRLGEIVLAWIRLNAGGRADAEDIRSFCKGRIAYFKIPEIIRFVEDFPSTPSGKIQKDRIRELERSLRSLAEDA